MELKAKALLNKKGQGGQIGFILLLLIFILNWFIWLGSWVGTVGAYVVQTNSLTGVEAFFFMNLNAVIFICLLLASMGWGYLTFNA